MKLEAKMTTIRINMMKAKHDDIELYKIRDEGNSLKPFDIIGVWGGRCFVGEIKILDKIKVTIEDVIHQCRRQQLLSLETYRKKGAIAWLIAYNKKDKQFYSFNYDGDGN